MNGTHWSSIPPRPMSWTLTLSICGARRCSPRTDDLGVLEHIRDDGVELTQVPCRILLGDFFSGSSGLELVTTVSSCTRVPMTRTTPSSPVTREGGERSRHIQAAQQSVTVLDSRLQAPRGGGVARRPRVPSDCQERRRAARPR